MLVRYQLWAFARLYCLWRCSITIYNGIKEVDMTEEELANFYSGTLKVDALRNQYVLLKLDGQIVDKYRYDGSKFIKVNPKAIDGQILSKIKSRNQYQDLLFDLLNTDIPLLSISGPAGSGKTFVTTAHALMQLQKEKYKRIVIIRNDVPVLGVRELGILPGDANDKMMESIKYLSDIITPFLLENMIQSNQIDLCYLGTMRSRSLSDCIVLCNESQNLTTEIVKMIISRIGDNSRLIFDYDLSQIDSKMFQKDNGMMAMAECLKGNELFGAVDLKDVERSAVARLAMLIN